MTGHYDVVIIGGGLAGLTLARHLLLHAGCRILMLEKRASGQDSSQKVGESLVQLSGYYLLKVLELEEHLLTSHYLKYNLRFHWRPEGSEGRGLEDYSVSFIRNLSNIPTFQLDRNLLEAHLLEWNRADSRFTHLAGSRNLKVELSESGPHRITFDEGEVLAGWVVDASGRAGVLKKQLGLGLPSPIRHGSTWCWVEGLVNPEKLTARSGTEVRLDRTRQKSGHFPFFLATNHFCGEGCWFWVIPLHGKTSLGLVYDHNAVPAAEVSNGRKMLEYVSRRWPLFAEDFAGRKILDEGRFLDYSYDCRRTIHENRWAMTGEAGRFSDPLYSPGSDLISLHNTLIVSCIRRGVEAGHEERCRRADLLMRVFHDAYVPSYTMSYRCLGDQETFALKYAWELAVYFGFYVLPFINDGFDDDAFCDFYLRKFGLLGPINSRLQQFLADYYEWKKAAGRTGSLRLDMDFYDFTPLMLSEKLFYQVGLARPELEDVLQAQAKRLEEFARSMAAHVYACVLGDAGVSSNEAFRSSIRLRELQFNPAAMAEHYAKFQGATGGTGNNGCAAVSPFLPTGVLASVENQR